MRHLFGFQDNTALFTTRLGVKGNRDQDGAARNRKQPEGRDIDHRQGVLDHTKEDRAEHGPTDGPNATSNGDSTDDASGHHFKLEPASNINVCHRIARHLKIAREPSQRSRNHKGQKLRFTNIDTRIDGSMWVAPNRENGATKRRACNHDAKHNDRQNGGP